MLLAVDIGNTSINIGLFDRTRLLSRFRLPSHPQRATNYYKNKIKLFLSKNSIEIPLSGGIISSVIPGLTRVVGNSLKGLIMNPPIVVDASLKSGIDLAVESPGGLGADRISNAVAGKRIFGAPVLVVDFGTATTISAVKGHRFIGGSILPGLRLMSEALGRGTARLPYVDIGLVSAGGVVPALGKNTEACIKSGILYGAAGAVERIIEEMEREENCRFKVVITGGYCAVMAHFLRRKHYVDPDLTLKGLSLIYERNT